MGAIAAEAITIYLEQNYPQVIASVVVEPNSGFTVSSESAKPKVAEASQEIVLAVIQPKNINRILCDPVITPMRCAIQLMVLTSYFNAIVIQLKTVLPDTLNSAATAVVFKTPLFNSDLCHGRASHWRIVKLNDSGRVNGSLHLYCTHVHYNRSNLPTQNKLLRFLNQSSK
jgi:hypothetical protein